MLCLNIPKEPEMFRYGITNKTASEIDGVEHKITIISAIIFYLIIYILCWIYLYTKEGLKASTFYIPLAPMCGITCTIILPQLGVNFIKKFFEKNNSKVKQVIKKKESLEKYKKDLETYEREIIEIREKYPEIEKFVQSETVNEKEYIKFIVKSYFLQELTKIVEEAEKLEKKRTQEDWWRNLSPDDFEKEVGNWYERNGYFVEVTKSTGDGGIDVIAEKDGIKTYIQCKHYNGSVGVGVVRELYGVMSLDRIKNGAMVCLDGVTSGAKEFANKSGIKIIAMQDLLEPPKTSFSRKSEDVGKALKFGEFYIMYEGWNNLEEALESMRTYKPCSGMVYALYQYYGFYVSVFFNKTKLELFNKTKKDAFFDYIIDANNFQVLYDITKFRYYHPRIRERHL